MRILFLLLLLKWLLQTLIKYHCLRVLKEFLILSVLNIINIIKRITLCTFKIFIPGFSPPGIKESEYSGMDQGISTCLVLKSILIKNHCLIEHCQWAAILFFKKLTWSWCLLPLEKSIKFGENTSNILLCSLCQPWKLVEFKFTPMIAVNYGP